MRANEEVISIMLKRTTNYMFLVAIYISGILIGGIYTPDLMKYAKQINAFESFEQHEQVQQKPQKKKPKHIYLKALA